MTPPFANNEPFFEFSSGIQSYNDAYNLAMTEMATNVVNGTFIAGAGWDQLWTRDTSFAVELAAGLVYPQVSMTSLKESVEKDDEFGDVWLQDKCGHFGGWPNLSDAIVGARGSWELYLITGDLEFLSWAYQMTRNSLSRAERDAYDVATGLFLGCSSFMESDSGYPAKYSMNGTLVGMTKALSTNMLHYEGYKLGSKMGQILGEKDGEIQMLQAKAEGLREKIRSRLWSREHGYYSYFEDEHESLVNQMEGLGESLVLLGTDHFEHDAARIKSIFQSTPRTKRGIPSLWPRFVYPKDSKCESQWIECFYHNGRIWPFVQGYWGLAAARHGQVDMFASEFANLVWLSQQRNTFAEFYQLDGTFPPVRRRQLWSDTGFLNLVHHGLFGLTFVPNGLEFHPVKPESLFGKDTISLRGLCYRNMTLDIYVSGSGSNLTSIKVNDHELYNAFVPAALTGRHSIYITMSPPLDSQKEMNYTTTIDPGISMIEIFTTFAIALFVLTLRKIVKSRPRLCPATFSRSESERLTQ
jgi:hypothetical protein